MIFKRLVLMYEDVENGFIDGSFQLFPEWGYFYGKRASGQLILVPMAAVDYAEAAE